MRPDPHEGRYPEPSERVVQPGTPEHETWFAEQMAKQRDYEVRYAARSAEIERPLFARGR